MLVPPAEDDISAGVAAAAVGGQVIDARDPLTYRSTDLEDYARDINAAKASLLLLNKSDLLPEAARVAWAEYLDSQGIAYIFWSAKLAAADAEDDSGECCFDV